MEKQRNNPFRGLGKFMVLWAGQSVSQLGSAMTAYALVVWSFKQTGQVMQVAVLLVCSLLPSAVLSVISGTVVDRLRKKTVMLTADALSACVTVAVAALASGGRLRVAHLYAVNALLGALGAFQGPASQVAASALSPREQYMRASGLQSLSGSLKDILSPVLATAALAFGGLSAVLIIDLSTFSFAFITLCLLRLPEQADAARGEAQERFFTRLRYGLRFLRQNKGVMHIIWYLVLINLIAGIGYYSVLSPMILTRTGGNEILLGYVNSCVGLGMLCGATLLSLRAPRGRKSTVMCAAYAISFLLCDALLGLGRTWPVWCAAAFIGNLPLPFGDGALSALLRENVPLSVQGRVFSARGALVQTAIMAGYLLGAVLADYCVEPVFQADNPVSALLRALLGEGEGRAMGLIFLLTSVMGMLGSLILLRDRAVRALDAPGREAL